MADPLTLGAAFAVGALAGAGIATAAHYAGRPRFYLHAVPVPYYWYYPTAYSYILPAYVVGPAYHYPPPYWHWPVAYYP